jgi:hypothetical protein
MTFSEHGNLIDAAAVKAAAINQIISVSNYNTVAL